MPEIGSATMSILPGACLLAVLGCQGSPRAVVAPAGPRGALDSTRLLATTDPMAARAWAAWRRAHPTADMTTLSTELEEGTLESKPFDSPFFATGYATPVLAGRRDRDEAHAHPIYGTPDESIPAIELPTRRELASSGLEPIVWAADGLDAYLVEVNGAARVDLADGGTMTLGWGRTNERPYTSLGRLLVEGGHAEASEMDLQLIRRLHRDDPAMVERLMMENDRVVFFDVVDADAWPRAASGVRLTPCRAVAVDPEVIPLGSVLRLRGPSIGTWYAVAVDVGGAIKGRRIDLYFGDGVDAMRRAGAIREEIEVDLIAPRTSSVSR